MPTSKIKGLPGLNYLSDEERRTFMLNNEDKLRKYANRPRLQEQAADILYNNQLFIDKFGQDVFDQLNNGTEEAYQYRNAMLRDKVIKDEATKRYSPFIGNQRNNDLGMGNLWEKYSSMSTDAWEKLLESDWKTPSEFEKDWTSQKDRLSHLEDKLSYQLGAMSPGGQFPSAAGTFYGENHKQTARERNQRILDHIYNEDADAQAKALEGEVNTAYSSNELANMSDEEVKAAFIKAITPGSYNGNMGIPDYASRYGDGSDPSLEMWGFSIDDMRRVLAQKAVYEKNLSPDMAATALNNDALRYITAHQPFYKRSALFLRDVGISALSYTADKVNGVYNIGLGIADMVSDSPTVYVDDEGNVLPLNSPLVVQDGNGNYIYSKNGVIHPVHREQVSRTTLHNMGKNLDGSDADGGVFSLNPTYWTRAEQFGTLNEEEQRQYEKIGSSPYKVAYNPNDDSDLWYESFKMMSFGLADGAAQLVPFGIGAAGKALSTASNVGRVGRAFGTALNYTGNALTYQSRFGQIAQGGLGALGIAYAYQRGSFQETLAKNLADTEEAVHTASMNDIDEQYNTDDTYRQYVDGLIDAKVASMKADILSQTNDITSLPVGEEQLDDALRTNAKEAVFNELAQERIKERKGSEEYANMQQEAINSAGRTAMLTFVPEAVKYGIVNTVGYRKYLYTNPAGLGKKVSSSLKGLREVTTDAGKQRLATEPSKFLTRTEKLKRFGKVAGSQMWGGAWTNGTDDMMVDAAERINDDSFSRYLRAYESGEPMAETYGLLDGLYSYWSGLNNSLGQETTWKAATVGGLGSAFSFTPHMTNIASLATKEGREAYKRNFQQRTLRNEDGSVQRDEHGNPVMEKVGWRENWRDRANFFIQNGVLNTYYGAKQNERDLQNHADYINNILDDYDDFRVIEDLLASDISLQNTVNAGDQKTAMFVKAIQAMNALDHLGNDSKDPATLSSVVENAKNNINRAAQMTPENVGDLFTEEETNNMIAQYYANNPGTPHSDYYNWLALHQIAKNAQKLQEASKAFDEAEKQVQSVERSLGRQIDPAVRTKMKMEQALNGHWQQRIDTMKHELDDSSSNTELSDDMLIPSYGGKKNAESLLKVYTKQQTELQKEIGLQEDVITAKEEALSKAKDKLEAAQSSAELYTAQQGVDKAQAELENAQQQREYLIDLSGRTIDKQNRVQNALDQYADDADSRVLTADEIFSMNPVDRARMLRPENRQLYSRQQQRELENLEQRLLMKDGDALQKIQDIALLTQRVQTNQDAYSRMAKNPEAAAVQLESQREQNADTAYRLINQRNAETVSAVINQFDESMKGHADVTQDNKEQFVFRTLRKLNPALLDIIDEDRMLPQYQKQVAEAKEWGQVTSDIAAIVNEAGKEAAWKRNMMTNVDAVISSANDKASIMSALEKTVDDTANDGTSASQDFDYILQGLEKIGYQRDATVLEERRQRREREAQAAAAKAAAKKKAEEDAQIAAAKAQAEAEERRRATEAQPIHPVAPDGSNVNSWDVAPVDADASQTKDEDIQPEVFDWNDVPSTVKKPSIHKSTKEQIGEKKQRWDVYTESDRETRDTKDGKLILGSAMQDTLYPAINYAVEAGVLGEEYRLSDNNVSIENSNKARKAVKALQELGIETPQQLIEYVEQNEGKEVHNKPSSPSVDSNEETLSIIDNGETVQGKSDSIDMQAAVVGPKEQHSSDNTVDVDAVNGTGEYIIETSAETLSGNAMSEYQSDPLQKNGILKHKQGSRPGDAMNSYYAWMSAAGIKLQNIIDRELGEILKRNPHAKVKFMTIRPQDNATHDGNMKRHLMLVLDYDNSINKEITSVHDPKNGGVITSQGKQYLVVGVVGYGNRNADKLALYDILFSNNPKNGYGLVRRGMGEFWRNNPSERFYVHPTLETEVVPSSLIPGYIVKQTEADNNVEYRNITDLLNDEQRNPLHFDMDSLAWGIQETQQFLTIGTPRNSVMIPRNPERNSGRAFVLIPAANGKLIPSYLKPLFYNEMKNGKLKDRVDGLLADLTAPQYATRLAAVSALGSIFYMDADKNFILVGKDYNDKGQPGRFRNQVSLVRDGKTFKTFVLDSNFDRQEFMDAIVEMNPRINITSSVLQSPLLLQQYDEAGALQTDVAQLVVAGSSYSIYGVDASGKMIVPGTVENKIPKSPVGTDFINSGKIQVVYKGQYYLYDAQEDTYTLNGELITDDETVAGLTLNRIIIERGLLPMHSEGIWDYYNLGTDEDYHRTWKINRNTKEIKSVDEETAKKIIDRIVKEKAAKEREKEAEKKLAEEKKLMEEAIDEGRVILSDEMFVVDPVTGELIYDDNREAAMIELEEKRKKGEEEEAPVQQQNPSQKDTANKGVAKPQAGVQGNTQTFNTLVNSKAHRVKVISTIKKKWPQAPTKVSELEQFLRGKNIEVDAIGTSETAVEAWIKTIEDCR